MAAEPEIGTGQALAFRLARSGLASCDASSPAAAAACPASDFARDGALLALAARAPSLTREAFDAAVEAGELVVAHAVRGAIHALDPQDVALFGAALLAGDDDALGVQLGRQVRRLCEEHGIGPREALEEVAAATAQALAGGPLDRTALHAELRGRVRDELLPWCRSCRSHHVAPMLWRFATVAIGARLDTARRYVPSGDGPGEADPREALRRFLGFYAPARPADWAAWAGLAGPHARALWDEVAGELAPVRLDGRRAWVLEGDLDELRDPPAAEGVVLLPPGDPFLQKPNRPLLAPEKALQQRLFRPVASPGAVLAGGRLAGLWKLAKAGRGRAAIAVEPLAGRLPRRALEAEAARVAALRGAPEATVELV